MSVRFSRRAALSMGTLAVAGSLTLGLLPATSALADPSSGDWYRLRQCESSNNYQTDTGNAHYGAYQFDKATWRSVGGSGLPSNASKGEQDARALILYRERGWQPWQCAAIVGLHDDSDAKSGRISDIKVPGSSSKSGSGKKASGKTKTSSVPAYPSTTTYQQGVTNSVVARWQKQMARRGAPLQGTGVFGAVTTAVVKAVQQQNGIGITGILGPNTWRLAWTGKYHRSAVKAPVKATAKVPAFTGPVLEVGAQSPVVAAWQRQLHARGVKTLTGTGLFGPNTLAWVRHLQRINGLGVTGLLGPNTFKLAWTGRL